MSTSLRIVFFLSLCVALTGCGAKGALILPEKAVPIEAPAEMAPETPVPTDAEPTDATTTTPADQQAEDAVDDPAPPAEND